MHHVRGLSLLLTLALGAGCVASNDGRGDLPATAAGDGGTADADADADDGAVATTPPPVRGEPCADADADADAGADASGPAHGEIMYHFLDKGDLATADAILNDVWLVPRFAPVALPHDLTWNEDPYGEKYWQFDFYGLRPTAHLLWAWRTTGESKYRDRLLEIIRGFAANGQRGPFSTDKHGTAWRGMVLVNTWGKLHDAGGLSTADEAMFASLLANTAAFLEDPQHFEPDYNHGIAEAASLLLIAVNRPDLPNAAAWRKLALARIVGLMHTAIAADGVGTEQSPYYHFYILEQLGQIAAWSKRCGVDVGTEMPATVLAMLRFATHIALPDGNMPLMGASLAKNIQKSAADIYDPIVALDASFEYVVKAGKAGVAPPDSDRLVRFPISGPAILRSDFDAADYAKQTHVVLDVGPYRTSHSDRDALALHVYAEGRTLLADSGLFSYESSADKSYFHGTRAHNTVVVDGLDQQEGAPVAGLGAIGPGWTYQSGSHTLYAGVTHKRAVVLLSRNVVLVVDSMSSATAHDFTQSWHFRPEVDVAFDANGVLTAAVAGKRVMTMRQAEASRFQTDLSKGSASPVDGWYSEKYEIKTPAFAAHVAARASAVRFATLVTAGTRASAPSTVQVQGDDADLDIDVTSAADAYAVHVHQLAGVGETVTVTR